MKKKPGGKCLVTCCEPRFLSCYVGGRLVSEIPIQSIKFELRLRYYSFITHLFLMVIRYQCFFSASQCSVAQLD